jgi:hypothetical protein
MPVHKPDATGRPSRRLPVSFLRAGREAMFRQPGRATSCGHTMLDKDSTSPRLRVRNAVHRDSARRLMTQRPHVGSNRADVIIRELRAAFGRHRAAIVLGVWHAIVDRPVEPITNNPTVHSQLFQTRNQLAKLEREHATD